MKKQLVWYGPPYSYSGYATHNRCMLFELHKLGWDIRLIPTESGIPEDLIGKKLLKQLVNNTHINPRDSIVVNLIPPPALPLWGKHTILFTTLESDTIHEGYMRRCLQFDEIWVPCKANIKSFRRAGYPKKNLTYCPEGVYSQFFSPAHQNMKQYKSDEFTFFYNGDWSFRKGFDVLIPAFAKAFSPTDNVRLLLLAHYQGQNKENSRQHITSEFIELCNSKNIQRFPHIEFIYDYIPDPFMPDLINCTDVFVFPTRGEAWGLPAIQSMSCGKPVITTNWGGQLDYCNHKNSYLIDVEKFDTMDDYVSLHVDFYKYQKFAFPSEKHLIKLFQRCFKNQAETRKKGAIARCHVQKNFQWQNSGKIADKKLSNILTGLQVKTSN